MHKGIQAGATNISNSNSFDESDNEPGISRKSSDSGFSEIDIDPLKLGCSYTDKTELSDPILICIVNLFTYIQYLNADYAKQKNNPLTLKELITDARYGADKDSLLHTLIDKNATEETINFLIKQSIDINLQNKYGVTPLHLAVEKENIALIRRLVNAGANTNIFNRSCYGATPLHIAAANGNLKIVKILVEEGKADINSSHKSEPFQGPSPIHSTIVCANDNLQCKQGCLEVIKYLIKQPQLEVNAKDHDGKTALHYAVQDGNIDVVKLLLTAKNINLFIKDCDGKTPFDYAREIQNSQIFKAILDAKYGYDKDSLLHLAATTGEVIAVKYLVDNGVNANSKNALYHTPLHLSAGAGHTDITRILINKGQVDVNAFDYRNHTALHYAVNNTRLGVIELLLNSGADVNAVGTQQGSTKLSALHIAVDTKDLDTVKLLIIRPDLKINLQDYEGKTIIDCAKEQILQAKARNLQCREKILDVLNIRCDYDEQISRCNKKSLTFGCLALLVANFILIGLYVRSNFLQEAVINITQGSHYIYAAFMLGVSILIGAGFIRHNYITKKSIEKNFNHQILNVKHQDNIESFKDKNDNQIGVGATLSNTEVENINDLVESQLIA